LYLHSFACHATAAKKSSPLRKNQMKTSFFMFFCLDTKEPKNQGCIKNSILHLQNLRKWNDFRAQLSTFPFARVSLRY
jgi:hypothetical protein